MQVTGNVEHIYYEDTRKKTLPSCCYEIHLRPTAILHNLLPVGIRALTCGTVTESAVEPGQSRHLTSVEPGSSFIVLKVTDHQSANHYLSLLSSSKIILIASQRIDCWQS